MMKAKSVTDGQTDRVRTQTSYVHFKNRLQWLHKCDQRHMSTYM